MSRLLPFLALLALAGCDNMQHQANRRPLTPSALFPDGASARPPPAHTVAADADPEPPPPPEGNALAGLYRGRELFNADCAPCHGQDGYGTGIVVRRGFPQPDSLHSPAMRALTDAQLEGVIAQGKGAMYPLSDRLAPDDRRRIVAYVRALQLSQHAEIAQVPEGHRGELGTP